MGRPRITTLVLTALFVLAPLSGCLGGEEEEPAGFEWGTRNQPECSPVDINITCKEYLSGFTTPTNSLHHPTEDEIWISDLDGRIFAWNGDEKRLVANISSLISNCHTLSLIHI